MKDKEGGFTLMEIMVAVMVLAITLTVILQLFSGGLKAERLSEDYTRAVYCARSTMETLLLYEEMTPETLTGECDGGFFWQAGISSLAPEEKIKTRNNLVPFRVDLEVNWSPGRGGKKFKLATIHLARLKEAEHEE